MLEKELCYMHNYTGDYLSHAFDKLEEFQGTTIWKHKKSDTYTALLPSLRPTMLPYLVADNLSRLKTMVSENIEYCEYMDGRCPHCKRLYD